MITYNSDANDIIREVNVIEKEMSAKELKAYKVFKAWAQRNKRKQNIILSKQMYIINNNKVHCWWVGEHYKDVNMIVCRWIVESFIIDGKIRYITQGTGKKPIIFTNHFCKRLKERHNQSFLKWFERSVLEDKPQGYNTNQDTNEFVTIINDMYILGEKKDGVYYIKTTLNENQLYENQINTKNSICDFVTKETERHDKEEMKKINYHHIVSALKWHKQRHHLC